MVQCSPVGWRLELRSYRLLGVSWSGLEPGPSPSQRCWVEGGFSQNAQCVSFLDISLSKEDQGGQACLICDVQMGTLEERSEFI